MARFTDKSPAVISRPLGTGRVYYVAALPGVASLYTALQPPVVPDRGPNTHSVPTGFDEGVRLLLDEILSTAGVEPRIGTDPELIDARLIAYPGGFILPLANYEGRVGGKVTLSIEMEPLPQRVVSAYHGALRFRMKDGRVEILHPSLGYGDMLRIETAEP